MATDSQALAIPEDSPTTPLYEQIAKFQGKPYTFLLYLLKHPGASYNEARRSMGLSTSPGTLQGWKQLPGFVETLARISSAQDDLRIEYAKAAFLDAVPVVADSMVTRATSNHPASQRAAERILETTGVLRSATEAPDRNDLASLAVRIYTNRQAKVAIAVQTSDGGPATQQLGPGPQASTMPGRCLGRTERVT